MESGDVSNYVKDIVQKALKDYIPSATSSNSMTTTPLSPTILWRPNNYRLAVRFCGRSNSMLGNLVKHTGLIFWRRDNITVQVGRDKVVGIWNQGRDRQTWRIGRDSLKELDERLDEVKNDIMGRIKDAVLEYARLSNIELLGDFWWVRHEDWVKGEEYIDRIPREFTIHDTVFKKVYNESAIEFTGGLNKPGTAEIKSYIKNRVVEDFAPEIAKELDRFNSTMDRLHEVTLLEIENKKLHMSVLHDMKDTLHSIKDAQIQGRVSSPLRMVDSTDSFPSLDENVGRDGNPRTMSTISPLPTISMNDSRGLKALKLSGWYG